MAVSERLPGFDDDKHDQYVAQGYCAAVHDSKVYCCLPEGHDGVHLAVRLMPNGRLRVGCQW